MYLIKHEIGSFHNDDSYLKDYDVNDTSKYIISKFEKIKIIKI